MTEASIDMSLNKAERIMQAAEFIFAHKGYSATTLDEIIKLADTGKGTLYKYYTNKENLFYVLVEKKNKQLVEQLEAIEQQKLPFEQKLEGYITALTSFFLENNVLWQVIMFELTGTNRGWQIRNGKKGLEVVSIWGTAPTKEEQEIVIKYYKLLAAEFSVLERILQGGIKQGVLQAHRNISLWARHLYGGIAMLVFSSYEEVLEPAEVASIIVDRFMNGHANKKGR